MLKTLPEETQAKIWEHLQSNSYEKTEDWCKDQLGVVTSGTALSVFYPWYSMRLRSRAQEGVVQAALEEARRTGKMDTEELRDFGDALFLNEALGDGDQKAWVALRKMQMQVDALQLDAAKLELAERKHADALKAKAMIEEAIQDRSLTKEELSTIAEKAIKII